jgi:hypothetical protein
MTARWDRKSLYQDFEVLCLAGPWIIVKRRSDGVVGSVEVLGPGTYSNFSVDGGQDA